VLCVQAQDVFLGTRSAKTSNVSAAVKGGGVTVYNNCGNDVKYWFGDGTLRDYPQNCMWGNYCNAQELGLTGSMNTAIQVTDVPNCATKAEVTFTGGVIWYDISKIKGFNLAVAIGDWVQGGSGFYCADKWCDVDQAYASCDTSVVQSYTPPVRQAYGDLDITFCPDGHDNWDDWFCC
jgi:hypothetical protein